MQEEEEEEEAAFEEKRSMVSVVLVRRRSVKSETRCASASGSRLTRDAADAAASGAGVPAAAAAVEPVFERPSANVEVVVPWPAERDMRASHSAERAVTTTLDTTSEVKRRSVRTVWKRSWSRRESEGRSESLRGGEGWRARGVSGGREGKGCERE